MGYRLKPHKNAAKDVRRIARDRLERAIEALRARPDERDKGVHQARKRFKEQRALLRLIRRPLGKCYAVENRRLRNVGRSLSALRDAAAMVEGWDALASHAPALFGRPSYVRIRQRLVERGSSGGAQIDPALFEQAIGELDEALGAIEHWPLSGKGFGLFERGLEDSYRAGRRALAAARRDPNDENLHEWRKRVKDQWYHTRLLLSAWPAMMRARCGLLEELAEALGHDHDLAVMSQLMDDEPELFADQIEPLQRLIAERRKALRDDAFTLGRRLYAESPSALVKRWQRYWSLARCEGQAASRED